MRLTTDASLAASLLPVKPMTTCKICGEAATLHGVVDFNKTCEAFRGRFFPLAGVPIWYHRCGGCQFLFTEQFDHWPMEMFRYHIYNDEYIAVDPDAGGSRAHSNAAALMPFARQVKARRILDYGGGDGAMADALVASGFDALSWDPMRSDRPVPPPGGFDLVTAYEVLEHTPRPMQTCEEALSFLRPGGLFLFSTLTLDQLSPQASDHWYIAPRNGHISIHTSRSLERMFASVGRTLHHFNQVLHLAYPTPPAAPP